MNWCCNRAACAESLPSRYAGKTVRSISGCSKVMPPRRVSVSLRVEGALAKRMVKEHERGHCLHHRDRSRQNARVVPATRSQLGLLAGDGDGLLLLRDGRGRLECDAKENVLAVADAALHAAGAVAFR